MSVAFGVPARVVAFLKDVQPTVPGASVTCQTLADAVGLANRLPEGVEVEDVVGVGGGGGGGGKVHGDGRVRGLGMAMGKRGVGVDGERYFDCPPPPPPMAGVGRGGRVFLGEGHGRGHGEGEFDPLDMDLDMDGDVDFRVDGHGRRFSVGSGSSSRTARSSLRGMGLEGRLGNGMGVGAERVMHRDEARGLLQQRGRSPQQRTRRFEVEAVVLITVGVALLVCFFFAGVVLGASKVAGLRFA
jgi:hypothetical protein